MRLLLVCYDSPFNRGYGAGLRTNSIWQVLGQVGEVRALVMEQADHTALDSTPREGEIGRIRFDKPLVPWTTPETLKIRRLVAELAAPGQFDIVVVRTLRLAMLIRGAVPGRIVVDGDDMDKVGSTLGKSFARRQLDAAKTVARRTVTRLALGRYAHVWYVNPLDMTKFPSRSGSVLPNITDAPAHVVPRVTQTPPRVLMVGKFGYEPNAEGAEFFIRTVLPRLRSEAPGTRFRLVGQCPEEFRARWGAAEGVEIAGFVDDLAAEYARATAVVAPVFSGGGTQIKVLEALGHSCGTVVSGFSAVGFAPYLRADEHMLVARDQDDWVAHCLTLFNSAASAERLGRAGRAVVLERYSLDGMAQEVRATISGLTGTP